MAYTLPRRKAVGSAVDAFIKMHPRPKKSTLLREIDSTFIYHGKESCFSLLKALEGKGEDSSGSESHVVWVLVSRVGPWQSSAFPQ